MSNILETDRLQLREFRIEDAPFIYELLNSPGWLANIGDRNIRDINDAGKYIENSLCKSYEDHGFGLYLMVRKSDAAPIGMAGLIKRDFLDHVDIGFGMLPGFMRQGYAYEASQAVMHYAQETLGLKRILAITSPDNIGSQQLLGKLGLSREKEMAWPETGEALVLFGTGE